MKSENPDATFGELSQIIGGMWRGLSADEKKVRCVVLYGVVVDPPRHSLLVDMGRHGLLCRCGGRLWCQ